MPEYVVNEEDYKKVIETCFLQRGFDEEEAHAVAAVSASAAKHGIKTHNGIKAIELDDHLGSRAPAPGCQPQAPIAREDSGRFPACEVWNANHKIGQPVALAAMERAIELADQYGIGIVSVDNAFHYLWGGYYVMEAARRGYIAYTNCTSTLAEVVPFQGKSPTMGTNPHSWGFPTVDSIGFPIVIDWASSATAMGRVAQCKREGTTLPPASAVDSDGKETTDPNKVAALVPFGAHKGYGLALINELVAGFIGGGIPTVRGRPKEAAAKGERWGSSFFFQVIHPDALASGALSSRGKKENVKAVVQDVLRDNENAILPGQLEHDFATRCEKAGGIIVTVAEKEALTRYAEHVGISPATRILD